MIFIEWIGRVLEGVLIWMVCWYSECIDGVYWMDV